MIVATRSIERLRRLCEIIPPLLEQISDPEFLSKPSPEKWSKKEIIGHLIDSATNNHHRFVRGQFEKIPLITYDQNNWNQYGYYQQMESGRLISFWTAYNKHLLELIKRIPADKLSNTVDTGGDKSLSLEFLINDYVSHLEHHLRQVVTY